MAEGQVERAALAVPDVVFENPVVQERWSVTVQHVVWGLIGITVVSLLGTFILAWLVPTVPDTIVLLGSTVATGCISGLVGFIAGQAAKN